MIRTTPPDGPAPIPPEPPLPPEVAATGGVRAPEFRASSHPATFECLEAVSHDMGAGAGHASYVVADSWVGELAIVEDEIGRAHV